MQVDLSELESEEDEVPGSCEEENGENEGKEENEDATTPPIEEPQHDAPQVSGDVFNDEIPASQPVELPDSMMEVPCSQVCPHDEEIEDGHISENEDMAPLPPPTSPACASPILISDSPAHYEEKSKTEMQETKGEGEALKRMVESRESIDDKISELTQKLQNAKKLRASQLFGV